jgi:hypothetical protein
VKRISNGTLLARILAALTLFSLLAHQAASAAPEATACAVVYSVSGEAWVTVPPGMERRPLRLFDWLVPGSIVQGGPGATVRLGLSNGARYELSERSQAKLTEGELVVEAGSVRPLERVSTLPRVLPLAEDQISGSEAGAVRVRGMRIRMLYPRSGARVLANSAVLRFALVPGAATYRVCLEDQSGRSILEVETQQPEVRISAGILKPGEVYFWRVRTLDKIGQAARAQNEFTTVGAEEAQARAALRKSLHGKEDPDSLALLGEVDRALGLLWEARETLRAATALAPENSALSEALERLERRLAADIH